MLYDKAVEVAISQIVIYIYIYILSVQSYVIPSLISSKT